MTLGASRVAARSAPDARDSRCVEALGRASERSKSRTDHRPAATSDALLLTRTPVITVMPNGERGGTVIACLHYGARSCVTESAICIPRDHRLVTCIGIT